MGVSPGSLLPERGRSTEAGSAGQAVVGPKSSEKARTWCKPSKCSRLRFQAWRNIRVDLISFRLINYIDMPQAQNAVSEAAAAQT